MPRDGAGNYSVPNTFLPNTVMSATAVNQNFTDAGTALTGSLPRDGQAAMTGQFKAIAGTQALPGIAFGVDTNTGFRRASEDEMRWVTGGTDRFYIDSTGKAFHLGAMDIAGDIGLTAPIVIATSSASLLTLRRTENDTTERIVEIYQSGSGVGANGTLSVIGDGNNAVNKLRWSVNSIPVFETTSSLFTSDVSLAVGSNITINSSGFIDLAEVATPSNPAANVARLYALDVAGLTKLQYRDSSGNITTLPAGTDLQVFTTSGTWTKPAYGTVALIQTWAGGASGGRAGANDGGGGGGGGAFSEAYIALASISSSVSVTVGAGGAAQTADNTAGNAGGNTSFGAYLVVGGGGGGSGSGSDNGGGGGGGLGANVGAAGAGGTGGAGGAPLGQIGAQVCGAAGNANPFGGGGGSSGTNTGGQAVYGGGGGGFGSGTNTNTIGGGSMFGGGGGGGGTDTGTGSAGGTAIVYGGNGGAGSTDVVVGVSGTAPGGGGGGSENANSGAGARGEIRVMVW